MENRRNIYYRPLTVREENVMRLIALGYDNHEIAEKMSISTHTVKAFVANILRKLDAKNRTNAVYIALSIGIIPDNLMKFN